MWGLALLRAILFLSNKGLTLVKGRLTLAKKTSVDWGLYINCQKMWQSFLRALFLGRTKHFQCHLSEYTIVTSNILIDFRETSTNYSSKMFLTHSNVQTTKVQKVKVT